jgi:hypothetical protein
VRELPSSAWRRDREPWADLRDCRAWRRRARHPADPPLHAPRQACPNSYPPPADARRTAAGAQREQPRALRLSAHEPQPVADADALDKCGSPLARVVNEGVSRPQRWRARLSVSRTRSARPYRSTSRSPCSCACPVPPLTARSVMTPSCRRHSRPRGHGWRRARRPRRAHRTRLPGRALRRPTCEGRRNRWPSWRCPRR